MTKPNHSTRGHAEFSPSSLKYVAGCAGYVGKNTTSEAAEKGTRIHEALEVRDPSALHNEEELDLYEQIVVMEAEFMNNFGAVRDEHNEIQVDVALTGTETYGTCDRFLILESGKRAVMADYKTGVSLIDPPENNYQAKAYVTGAFQQFPELDEIVFVFYVPVYHSALHHTFKRSDLPALIADLSHVIKEGERVRPKWLNDSKPDLDDLTATQYCRFCDNEDKCPALGAIVLEVARKIDSSLPDVDFETTDDAAVLCQLFDIACIVEKWAERVKARAKAKALAGDELPTLQLRSMGRSKSITDNVMLVKVAKSFGLTLDEILDSVTLPLAKLSKLASSSASRKEKKRIEEDFIDSCEDAGIVTTSDERFTLVSRN